MMSEPGDINGNNPIDVDNFLGAIAASAPNFKLPFIEGAPIGPPPSEGKGYEEDGNGGNGSDEWSSPSWKGGNWNSWGKKDNWWGGKGKWNYSYGKPYKGYKSDYYSDWKGDKGYGKSWKGDWYGSKGGPGKDDEKGNAIDGASLSLDMKEDSIDGVSDTGADSSWGKKGADSWGKKDGKWGSSKDSWGKGWKEYRPRWYNGPYDDWGKSNWKGSKWNNKGWGKWGGKGWKDNWDSNNNNDEHWKDAFSPAKRSSADEKFLQELVAAPSSPEESASEFIDIAAEAMTKAAVISNNASKGGNSSMWGGWQATESREGYSQDEWKAWAISTGIFDKDGNVSPMKKPDSIMNMMMP